MASQSGYAAQILYLLSLCFAKITLLSVFIYLARNRTRKILVQTTMCFTVLWALASILTLAFQCDLPQTWATLSGKCIDMVGKETLKTGKY